MRGSSIAVDPVRRAALELQRPLLLAAADRFAGLARVSGLGHALRAGCDRILAVAPATPPTAALAAWRQVLAGFDALDRQGQMVEVARGLRLVQGLVGAPGAPVVAQVEAARAAAVARAASADPAAMTPPAPRGGGAPTPPRAAPPTTAGPATSSTSRSRPAGPSTAPLLTPDDPLAQPTTSIKGIGPALGAALAARGLNTVEDLLWLVPRRWLDAREVAPIAEALGAAVDGERVGLRATVVAARTVRARGRAWGEVRLGDGVVPRALLVVRFFGVWAGIDRRFPVGAEAALSGPVKQRAGQWEMANPDVLGVASGGAVGDVAQVIPRYPDVPGVPAGKLRTACQAAAARVATAVDDGVPAEVAARQALPPLATALATLHAPAPSLSAEEVVALNACTSPHHRRLAFAELFALGAVVARRRRALRADHARPLPPSPGLADELARALPFALTRAQARAVAELGGDLARATPMNRLLQGDVGAGKTAVAFAAALHAIRAGAQVAIMAPTEILAEQHHATFGRWCAALGVRTTLLTASTGRATRASTLALIAAGDIGLVVGTHALLADAVGFARLGLAIIDEQHRFGVAQRVRLRGKGDGLAPHLLVMTATPIPRTLALTAFGDLDATVIDELPPGRTAPTTVVGRGGKGRAAAYAQVVARCQAGERAFVVCPLVEASTDEQRAGWADATSVHAELAAKLAPLQVGLVHGRLPIDARDAVMAAFVRGELDVLVATTVIEVGVDVPAATVMVIEDADHFGLAQLHQLRGRIGRGGGAAWCHLLSRGERTEDGAKRLEVIAGTTDGFRIAEEDLLLRGPGELIGARQAGVPRLRFGDLASHTELLLAARREAEAVIAADPTLAQPPHAALRRLVERREAAALAFGAEGG
ncbi:MAG: ATP-dependent DNA helicase RecG [Myxococcales bacterium]|nr:ATP-dependent DNA helicase RecG [Myxococcales bacterium]MBK7194542.1 ATP-dependent DNA helicase RecG [Myxococcales bacterium]MBP6843472.1 ATP-dependent DNA helicase RecG [Kofleriaceae bacterium]